MTLSPPTSVSEDSDPKADPRRPQMISEVARARLASALERIAPHDSVTWDVTPIVGPDPTQPQTLHYYLAVTIQLPALSLKEKVVITSVLPSEIQTQPEEVYDQFVRQTMEELRRGRDDLAKREINAPAAPLQESTASGLIVPR